MFASEWAATGSHAFAATIQRHIGDVIWYEFSLEDDPIDQPHDAIGCRVKFVRSSWVHRRLWRAFYRPSMAWRWRWAYPAYAPAASYSSVLSLDFARALVRDRPDVLFLQDYSSGRFDVLW